MQAVIAGVNLPKTKNGLKTITKLCSKAEKLFAEKGFYATSVADICNDAKIAIGTFYIYFESKTAIYCYLVQSYQSDIKKFIASNIAGYTSRYEKERAGIKAFVLYAKQKPQLYKIIWGCLSVDEKLFVDYYVSFARSYYNSLNRDIEQISAPDLMSLAYFLMGVTNFIALRAIVEDMSDEEIDKMIDDQIMPILKKGFLKD